MSAAQAKSVVILCEHNMLIFGEAFGHQHDSIVTLAEIKQVQLVPRDDRTYPRKQNLRKELNVNTPLILTMYNYANKLARPYSPSMGEAKSKPCSCQTRDLYCRVGGFGALGPRV